MKLLAMFMLSIAIPVFAQTAPAPPKPISTAVTHEASGVDVEISTYRREDVQRYDAFMLGADYKAYLRAKRKLYVGKSFVDKAGYTWSESSGGHVICRLRGDYGSCVSH